MRLDHPRLVQSLTTAYSAEKAAAYAYIGHAKSLCNPEEKARVKQIEMDEWDHRSEVLKIMRQYDLPISEWYECKFAIIGRVISFACHFIGRFMPYFFAGKLESGNVCEYFVMIRYFHELGITEHDQVLYEMGVKEKEHEVYFQEMITGARWLPLFEWVFNWGTQTSANDVELDELLPLGMADQYCQNYKQRHVEEVAAKEQVIAAAE